MKPLHMTAVFVTKLPAVVLATTCLLLAPTVQAGTISVGTEWTTSAMTGQVNSGAAVGFWAPNNQGSLTGFTLTPDTVPSNGGTPSGTVYLQNVVAVNATSGAGTAGFLSVIDTTTNTVVGASSNSVTSTISATQSTMTPWNFNNLALDSTKRYAFMWTTTAGVAGTVVNAVPADGNIYTGDLDPSAGVLTAVNYRIGGAANNGSNLIAGTGALLNSGGPLANYEQWVSASFTSTSQALTTLDSGAGTTTQGGVLSVAGIRKIGTGTFVLDNAANANTGDVIVENGVLQLNTASGGTTAAIVGGAGQILLNNSNGGAAAVSQNSLTMNGSTLNVDTSLGNATLNTVIEGAGNLNKLGANTLTVTADGTYTGATRISGGTLAVSNVQNRAVDSHLGRGNSSNSSIVLNGGTLRYTGAGASTDRILAVGASATNTLDGSGTGALSFTSTSQIGYDGVTGARTLNLIGSNTGNNTLAQIIGDNTGATSLVKDGAGTWVLTAANTYSGTTIVSGGTLRVSGGGALGSGAITVSGGAKLEVDTTAGNKTFAQNIGGAGTIQKTSANNLVLQGTNSFSGQHQVDGGFLVFDGINTENGSPRLNLNGGNLALGAAFAGNTATLSELMGSGNIDPAFGATVGTKTLAVTQSTNTVYSGMILADNAGRIIALTKDGAGTLDLTGVSSNSGPTNILGGTLRVSGGGLLGSGGITVNGGAELEVDTAAGSKTFAQNIGGAGTIQKTSANNLILQGTNSFSGLYQIDGGYVVFDSIGAEDGLPGLSLGPAGNVALAQDFAGGSATVSSLAGSGQVTVNFEAATAPRTLDVNQSINTVFSGQLNNAGLRVLALTKDGAGTLTLTGVNSYTGLTTVDGGVLELAGAASLQNGQISVAGGTFLQSSGTNNVTGAAGVGNLNIANVVGAAFTLNGGTLDFQDTTGATGHYAGATQASQINIGASGAFNFNGGILRDVSLIDANSTTGATNDGLFAQYGGTFVIGQDEGAAGGPLGPPYARTTTINGGFSLFGGTVKFDAFGPDVTPADMTDAALDKVDRLMATGNVFLNDALDFDDEYGAVFGDIHTVIKTPGLITLGPNYRTLGGFARIKEDGMGGLMLQIIVPEPASMAVWSLVGLAGAAAAWRLRRRSVRA